MGDHPTPFLLLVSVLLAAARGMEPHFWTDLSVFAASALLSALMVLVWHRRRGRRA